MFSEYVHGYTEREAERLHDQANTLRELLHHDSRWPPGSLVLEGGTGVVATTAFFAGDNPETRVVSLDASAESLLQARENLAAQGLDNVRRRADLRRARRQNAQAPGQRQSSDDAQLIIHRTV